MGIFHVRCEVQGIRPPVRAIRARLLVDTGAEDTWVPEGLLRKAGIRVVKKDIEFVMANGTSITRSIGYAIVRCGEFETVDEVVFGRPGDLSLLGARCLEGFGAHVDPRGKRLVAAGPRLVAPCPRPAKRRSRRRQSPGGRSFQSSQG